MLRKTLLPHDLAPFIPSSFSSVFSHRLLYGYAHHSSGVVFRFFRTNKKLYGDSQDEDKQIQRNHSCTKKPFKMENWKPDRRIPSVRQLASQFSCSRTRCNGLAGLDLPALLYAKPQSGYYVLEQAPDQHERSST